MRKTALFLLPVKNLTTPSCSPTQISYKPQEFWRFRHKYAPNCIFFIAHAQHAQNGLISTFCQTRNTFCGTWYLPHSRVHKSIAELCSNFGDSAITKGQIAYFSLRMCETAKFLLSIKNLTSPSCSPIPISYMMQQFWRFGHKYASSCILFIAHAQNGLISTSCQNLTSPSCSPTSISYNMQEFWRFVDTKMFYISTFILL